MGLLSTYIIAGALCFSPVSPVAFGDTETLAQGILRRDFGVASLFLFGPVTVVILVAASSETLGLSAVRVLNVATGISVGFLDHTFVTGQAELLKAVQAQANGLTATVDSLVDNAFRFETNTAVPLCLSFSIVAICTLQGILAEHLEEGKS
jgi:hypothetical protein